MQQRRQRILTFTLIGLVTGFILLSVFVAYFPDNNIDLEFSEEVQENRMPMLDVLMKLVSYPGYAWISVTMAAIIAVTFLAFRYKKEALFTMLTLLSALVSTIIKAAVNRARPSADIVQVIEKTVQQSFPSGHTQFYVVFFGFMIVVMFTRRSLPQALRIATIAISLVLIFTIPFSRIYLGAHWFTDVLGGFIAGLICLWVLAWFYLRKRGDAV
ncbi:phosphatase PAP2 family protein [Mucilaginibacter sp. UR6-1]|uniref:phosphatase PAP2 family protein n=1 Tax=Mucilaginibacter sp. UR6-1 TaxID=1435643 RepID=UPI001E5E20A7|nr:phosphatase PAP2 family protein [Mucilaginibacter sp. UR6-1]MCC8411011.1 phosphatase PAP2 family protein [Mucilaginibacter sp. UR6-1]